MNTVKPHGLAAFTALCVLAVILLGTGCGAAAPGGSPVLGTSSSSDRTSTGQPSEAADSGLVACAYPLATQDVSAADYAKIRAAVAGSRWPDLRNAGTAYVDLAVWLLHPRGATDGYETVWFYQRLSHACARHGWKQPPA
jgi:hypothetical protein